MVFLPTVSKPGWGATHLNNINVGQKLLVAFGGTLLTLLLICGTMLAMQRTSMQAASANAAAQDILDDVDRALGGMHDQNASVRGLILYRLPRYSEKPPQSHR